MDEKAHIKYTSVPVEEATPPACATCLQRREKRKRCHKLLKRGVLFSLIALIGLKIAFFVIHYVRTKYRHNHSYNSYGYGYDYNYKRPDTTFNPFQCWGQDAQIWGGGSTVNTFDPKEFNSLDFSIKGYTSQGLVRVSHVDTDSELVTVNTTIYLNSDKFQDKINLKMEKRDEELSLAVQTPTLLDNPFYSMSSCVSVVTHIKIPKSLKALKSLRIDVPKADIKTCPLKDLSFAYVYMSSLSGMIEVKNLTSIVTDIKGVNTYISGDFNVVDNIDISTINGMVSAVTRLQSQNTVIYGQSINADVAFMVEGLKDNGSVDIQLKSYTGRVSATVPDTFNGSYVLSTQLGQANVYGGTGLHFDKNGRSLKTGFKGGDIDAPGPSSVNLESLTRDVDLNFA